MADKFLMALLRDPLGRMCLVITALFFLSGIGALTLMVGTTMQPEVAVASAPGASIAPNAQPKAEIAVASTAAPAAKEPTANSVIEATFGVLPIDIKPAAPKQHVAALDAPNQVPTNQPVKTRVVKTVSIDGTVTGSVTPATPEEKAIPQANPLMAYQAVQAGQQAKATELQVAALQDEPRALPEAEQPVAVAPVPKVLPEEIEAKREAKAEPKKAAPEPERQAAASEKGGASGQLGNVRVGNQAVNVRSGPSSKNGKLFFLQAGQQVAAIEIQKGWVRIRDESGREGWVYSSYISNLGGTAKTTQTAALETPKATDQKAATSGTMIVRGSGVTVRSGPSRSNGSVFTLAGGQMVTVNQVQKGWVFLTDAKGRSGWAYSKYLASNG